MFKECWIRGNRYISISSVKKGVVSLHINLNAEKGYQQELCSKMLLDMEQQHPASVLLSLNMSQFSSGTQQQQQPQQTTINQNNNNSSSANNNNNSVTTNLQHLHDHSSSSPPQTNNGAGGGGVGPPMTNNSNSNNTSGHFNNYVTLNNNNSQQQNYQNLYNFDTNQYIFSSSGKWRTKGR